MAKISEVRLESIDATHSHIQNIHSAVELLQEAERDNADPKVILNLALRVSESLRQLDLTLVKLRKAVAFIESNNQ